MLAATASDAAAAAMRLNAFFIFLPPKIFL
jgi:hypothetical protein